MASFQIVRYYHRRYEGEVRWMGEEVLKEVSSRQEALDYLNTPEACSATCRESSNKEFAELHGFYLDGYKEVQPPPKDYSDEAEEDAKETVRNFKDEIVEKILEDGEASDDLLNDYTNGDAYHHENHVDKWYNLQEAAELLGQLSSHVETDHGLWEGKDPEEAIGAQAAFTYGNAVYSEWRDLIESINDDQEVEDLVDIYNELDGMDEDEFVDEDGEAEKKAVAEAMGELYKGESTIDDGKKAVKAAIEARIDQIIS